VSDSTFVEESIGFRLIPGFDGFQILDAHDSDRRWQVFNTQYAVAVSFSWDGDTTYRGGHSSVACSISRRWRGALAWAADWDSGSIKTARPSRKRRNLGLSDSHA
jgi:hypothetical protein